LKINIGKIIVKILVTGASGMLGSEIVHRLNEQQEQLGISELIKQRHQQTAGFVALNLAVAQEREQLADYEWDVVIHTAANRDPDSCAIAPAEAQEINVMATTFLAEEAKRRGAYMLYISTDYVFPGTNPPYNEDSPTKPINHYGKTKLLGEQAVLASSSENCSLRVPFLYGIRAGVEQAPMLAGSIKALLNSEKQYLDDGGVRYPTYTGDVAEAVILLLKYQAKGIFHCSSEDKTTKYRIATTIGDVLSLPHTHLYPQSKTVPSVAIRPHDSHLSTVRLKNLGWQQLLPLSERLLSLKDELIESLVSGDER
jgi:dTDP-4-dehydrorhamnose reductase